MASSIRIEKSCEFCGKKFIAKQTRTRACSLDCNRLIYKRLKRNEKIELVLEEENIKKPFNSVVKEKEFLSIKEACMLLGASRWTLYRLISDGTLLSAKLRSRTLIKRSTIDKLFK